MVTNFEDMFICFDIVHERDRRTDGRTDGHSMTAYTTLMHIIAREKVPVSLYNSAVRQFNFVVETRLFSWP